MTQIVEELPIEVDTEQSITSVDDTLLDFPAIEESEIVEVDVNMIEVESEVVEVAPELNEVDSESREWEMLNAPEMVGWLSVQEQEVLFDALLMFYQPGQSVLDAGCGRADLVSSLAARHIDGLVPLYKGIDYNENILNIARIKFPNVNVEAIDLLDFNEPETYDWVFASGMFNTRMDNAIEYAQQCVDKMFESSKVGVAFNLLTGIPTDLAEEDKAQIIVWDSGAWLNYLVSKYTKVICRTDYMEGDTTFFIFK